MPTYGCLRDAFISSHFVSSCWHTHHVFMTTTTHSYSTRHAPPRLHSRSAWVVMMSLNQASSVCERTHTCLVLVHKPVTLGTLLHPYIMCPTTYYLVIS
jgi:hypothetical protein